MKKYVLGVLLTVLVGAAHAEPLPVFASGYYSNIDYPFSDDWSVDFSDTVSVPIYLFEPGPLEVYSSTLNPHSEVWVTIDSAQGPRIDNPVRMTALRPTYLNRAFYISQELLDQSSSNRFYVHVESQPWGNDSIGDWFIVRKHYEEQQFEETYRQGVRDTELRAIVEGMRLGLMDQIGAINEYVMRRQMGHRNLAIAFSFATTKIRVVNSLPGLSVGALEIFAGALNEAQKTIVLTQASPGHETWVSALVDVGWGLYNASHGNYMPAAGTLIEASANVGVLISGLTTLYRVDEDVEAKIIAGSAMRHLLEQNGLPQWSDQDALQVGEYYAEILEDGADCGFFSNVFFQCYYRDFDQDTYLETFRNGEALLRQLVNNWQTSLDAYADVDLDGFDNLEEIAEGSDPNDPASVPAYATNRKPIAQFTLSASQVDIGDSVGVDASPSSDPDGDDILDYDWQLVTPSGSQAQLQGSGETVSFDTDVTGTYTVSLKVWDGIAWSNVPHVQNVNVQYGQPPEGPITLPTQWLVGSAAGGESGPEGWSRGLNQGDGWCVNVGNSISNGCFNAGPWVETIEMWLVDYSDHEPVGIAGREGQPPTLRTIGGNVVGFDDYDWLGSDGYQSNESFFIEMPEPGIYYVAAYAFANFTDASIYFQIDTSDDIDDDGVINEEDDFPRDPDRQRDSDGDGIADNFDDFPADPAASMDSDGDGYPDSWNPGYGASDSTMGLTLDHPSFVNDPNEWADSDDDGVGDNADAFPFDPAASIDSDGDGFPDNWNPGWDAGRGDTPLSLDAFPSDPAAAIDSDGDGYPDSWNPGAGPAQSTTGLALDDFPMNSSEWVDSDLDGVGDNSDWAPADPSEWQDSDGDGYGDNADVAPNDPARWDNAAPVLVAPQTVEAVQGEASEISVDLSDADGDTVALEIITDGAAGFVSLEGQTLMVDPDFSTEPGEYDLVLVASDSFGGEDASMVSVVVNSGGAPNLVADDFSLWADNPYVGTLADVGFMVINDGQQPAEATSVQFMRSEDAVIDPWDSVEVVEQVPGVPAGDLVFASSMIALPEQPGTYYYGACIYPVPSESDTSDNCSQAWMVEVLDPATQPPQAPAGINYPEFSEDGRFTIDWPMTENTHSAELQVSYNRGASWSDVWDYDGVLNEHWFEAAWDGFYYFRVRSVNENGASEWTQGGPVRVGWSQDTLFQDSMERVIGDEFSGFLVTPDYYPAELWQLEDACVGSFGSEYRLADWLDVKAYWPEGSDWQLFVDLSLIPNQSPNAFMTLEGDLMSGPGWPHVIEVMPGVVPPGPYAVRGPEFSFVATARDVEWQQVLCTMNPPVSYMPDPTTSTIDADPIVITAGESASLTVQLRDEQGNPLSTGGDVVSLASSAGDLSPVVDNGDGTYAANFSSVQAGSHSIVAYVNGEMIADDAIVSVEPGTAEPAASVIMAEFETVPVGDSSVINVYLLDQYGNQLTSGGDQVSCFIASGSANISSVTDNGDGSYSATLWSAEAGETSVGSLVNGVVIPDTTIVEFVENP